MKQRVFMIELGIQLSMEYIDFISLDFFMSKVRKPYFSQKIILMMIGKASQSYLSRRTCQSKTFLLVLIIKQPFVCLRQFYAVLSLCICSVFSLPSFSESPTLLASTSCWLLAERMQGHFFFLSFFHSILHSRFYLFC